MDPCDSGLPLRDRAIAELVRARGWLEDAAVDEAAARAARDGRPILEVLLRSGRLVPEQVASLSAAVDGGAATWVGTAVGEASPREAPARLGPYRVLREIGCGGMGAVYRAVHEGLGREVAVKVMLAGDGAGEEQVARFRREAELLARLGRHPRIVQIHEAGSDGGRLWFAMDFVAGRSLAERLRAEGPLAPREAAAVVADVAGALAAAHAAGVLHRDVKPHNILLDGAGSGYLGDFGLAKDVGQTRGLTLSGDLFGTPAYMSPEVATGGPRRATAASDVWSLGATLYEALAGRQPFEAPSMAELMRRISEDEPAQPSRVRPGVHPDLDVIVGKAMRKAPGDRYASAAVLEADLRRWLAGEAIVARPPGPGERLAAWASRRRGFVAGGAISVLLAACAAGFAGWKQIAQARDRDRREHAAAEVRARTDARRRAAEELLARAQAENDHGRFGARDAAIAGALRELDCALADHPGDAESHYVRGRALRAAGRDAEALAALEHAVRLRPNHGLALFEHGRIAQEALSRLRSQGRTRRLTGSAADHVFESMRLPVRFESQGVALTDEELSRMAAEDFRRMLATGVAPEKAAVGQAMLDHLAERHSAALVALENALRENPYDVDALRAASDVATAHGGAASAAPYFERLLAARPSSPEAKLLVALSEARAGAGIAWKDPAAANPRFERAARLLDEAMATSEPDLNLYLLGVAIHATLRRFEAARALTERAAPLARTSADRRAVEVARLAALSEGRASAALRELDRLGGALLLPERRAVRVSLLVQLGREGDALQDWRALAAHAELRESRLSEGVRVERACGNLEAAERLAREAAAHESWFNARGELGVVLMMQGRLQEALAEFGPWDRPQENQAELGLRIAQCLVLEGRYVDAFSAAKAGLRRSAAVEAAAKNEAFLEMIFKGLSDSTPPSEVMRMLAGLEVFTVAGAMGMPPDAEAGGGLLSELLALEQEYAFRHGLLDLSIAAGRRLESWHPHGLALLRHARALAAAGRREEALAALRRARELGWQEPAPYDGERAFDAVRDDPGFREVRKAMESRE
jgi:tetratricopeptide (TPR) repeat protein